MFDLISNVRGIFSNHFDNKSTVVGFNTLVQEYSAMRRLDSEDYLPRLHQEYISNGQTD